MTTKSFITFFILNFFCLQAFSQFRIEQGQIDSPVRIPIHLSGTFAELRTNHFHAGIDIRTQAKEGFPLYAVDDGVVSRIKVSPTGYGNAVYINHKNGITTVYGHLRKYNSQITEYVKAKQYESKSFSVDLFPSPKNDKLFVKKGDIIGYSGNSGSSGGPHLHYEVRNTSTERPLNPLMFGLDMKDNFYPTIQMVKIYSENNFNTIDNQSIEYFPVKINNSSYKLSKEIIHVPQQFSIGVRAIDHVTQSSDRNGYYSMKIFIDTEPFFEIKFDSISFDETKYINACMDYAYYDTKNIKLIKSKKLQGNNFSGFVTDSRNGVFSLNDDEAHDVLIEVADFSGKVSKLNFKVKKNQIFHKISTPFIEDYNPLFFKYDTQNSLDTNNLKISIQENSLYEDIVFNYKSKTAQNNKYYSDIHSIHSSETPIHKAFEISIKPENIPQKDKAIIVRIDKKGKMTSVGGKWQNDYITATASYFGDYAVAIDTIAPTIEYKSGAKPVSALVFSVRDNLSGIENYNGFLNNKWALVSWDPKTRTMKYDFDHLVQKGKNIFKLVIEDGVGNKTEKTVEFTK